MQSAKAPTYRFAGAGFAWYCPGRDDGCFGTVGEPDVHDVRWCDARGAEKHAWKLTPTNEWALVGYAPYDADARRYETPVAVEA